MTDVKEKSSQNKSNIETIPVRPYHSGLKYTAIAQILKRIPARKLREMHSIFKEKIEFYK